MFEKQDRNKEAMSAYERAIEIDGGNPQNWFELGNIHFKMENYTGGGRAPSIGPSNWIPALAGPTTTWR